MANLEPHVRWLQVFSYKSVQFSHNSLYAHFVDKYGALYYLTHSGIWRWVLLLMTIPVLVLLHHGYHPRFTSQLWFPAYGPQTAIQQYMHIDYEFSLTTSFPSRLLAHHGQSSSDKFASVSSAVSRRDTSTARQFRGFSCRTTLAGRAHLHDIQYLFHCPTLHSMGGFVLPHGRPLLRSFAWAVSPVTVTAPLANLAF